MSQKTKGGSLYSAPELIIVDEPEPNNEPLRFVDIPGMVEKNKDLLEKLTQDTIKKCLTLMLNTKIESMFSTLHLAEVKTVL